MNECAQHKERVCMNQSSIHRVQVPPYLYRLNRWCFILSIEVKVYGNASGKMSGVPHISVGVGESAVCKACLMKKICYAERIYPNPRASYKKNGETLASRVLERSEIPYVNSHICRFNAFGELHCGEMGITQLTNYVNICKKSPDTTFVIWSRNYALIEKFFSSPATKPENLKIIRSTHNVNVPVNKIPEQIWDGVFNVVTKEYADDHNIVINCGLNDEDGNKIGCARCPTGCYKRNNSVICYEVRK